MLTSERYFTVRMEFWFPDEPRACRIAEVTCGADSDENDVDLWGRTIAECLRGMQPLDKLREEMIAKIGEADRAEADSIRMANAQE